VNFGEFSGFSGFAGGNFAFLGFSFVLVGFIVFCRYFGDFLELRDVWVGIIRVLLGFKVV